jgi:hydrophobe/amphiphile efflux-1 (HAE1) family protein
MANFFIRRPIVAIVIAILTVIVGVITIATLPVAQFPNIAPPEITVQANYPGADAQTLEQAVAVPIEQQVNGVDNMAYMYSLNATANQQTTLFVDFDVKTDPNMDLMLTQSRQQLANGQLPPEVNNYGINLKKSATAPLMLISLYSPHGTRDSNYLANYAYINLNDPIGRLYGVGQTRVLGSGQYAMRLWVKPDQMAKLGITVTDIANALQAQNKVNPSGQIGGEPAQNNQQFTYAVLAQGRLTSPEQFGDVIVREAPNGGIVRVRDVARVELGTQDYTMVARLNGKPSAVIAVYQLPGTNAVQTVAGVRKLMAQMKQRFPQDIDFAVSLDQTLPVTAAMKEIIWTLVIAIVLVILVVYLFLQDWRATLIPMLAVPVSLVGTFVIFPLFGFSINTLSMFGLVLAIGLVVDDAIVVVEGVQRHIEEGLPPKDAARKAMEELTGPVIGIALVLSSVFVPTAFIPGITGRLYQQFAVTIAISVILSAFNALTLSPALASLLLRPKKETRGPLAKLFGWFNRIFQSTTEGYVRWSGVLVQKVAVMLLLLVACAIGGYFFGNRVPSSFLPDEDQGYVYINMQLPNAASLERTSAAAKQVEQVLAKTPGVQYTTSVVGFSLLTWHFRASISLSDTAFHRGGSAVVVSNHEIQPTRGLRLCNGRCAGRQETWKATGVAIEGDVVPHPTGGQRARHRQANRLAHIPADVHDFAARKRRRREGGAGVAPSRFGPNHHGRLRPGDDASQAQSPGKSGRDAAGHREEVELTTYCVPCVSPRKNGVSDKSFGLLASPTGFEPVLPP